MSNIQNDISKTPNFNVIEDLDTLQQALITMDPKDIIISKSLTTEILSSFSSPWVPVFNPDLLTNIIENMIKDEELKARSLRETPEHIPLNNFPIYWNLPHEVGWDEIEKSYPQETYNEIKITNSSYIPYISNYKTQPDELHSWKSFNIKENEAIMKRLYSTDMNKLVFLSATPLEIPSEISDIYEIIKSLDDSYDSDGEEENSDDSYEEEKIID